MLITPYGGELVNLLGAPDERSALRARAETLPSIILTERSLCDLELLAVGGFSPLARFMGRADYERVVHEMRLTTGTLFPIPITLPVDRTTDLHLDASVALRSPSNDLLGVLRVEEIYPWDRSEFSEHVLQTSDRRHPLVGELAQWGDVFVSGSMDIIELPRHLDFHTLRPTPRDTRCELARMGRPTVIAFQTRNPFHRVHEEMTKRAWRALDGTMLLHPVVGVTQPGDVDHYTRVRTYKAIVDQCYDADRVLLALLPLAMRMAGPREAVWHAIVRRNYGASHLIVGRDHASPGVDSSGRPFYRDTAAQELVDRCAGETGVPAIPFEELVYLRDEDRYEERSLIPPGAQVTHMSGTHMRRDFLDAGRELPAWFVRPEVAAILAEACPPLHRQGFAVWFTGFSGSGKSTTAEMLTILLLERGRRVTVLDGDVVRTHLSKGLGFSREDRDANILRIGFVAAEVVRHGGVAVCAAISPFCSTRDTVRQMVGRDRFIEIFVDTPLDVCEARDPKHLYAAARRGEVRGFTGLDDPYEPPPAPELTLETVASTVEENAKSVIALLVRRGLVRELH